MENIGRLVVTDRKDAGCAAAAAEMILEGLWAHRRIGRSEERGNERVRTITSAGGQAIFQAADALDRQAADLSADAAKESPVVEELANKAERLRRSYDGRSRAGGPPSPAREIVGYRSVSRRRLDVLAVTTVTGTPSCSSRDGRSRCSQCDTRVGSVDRKESVC